MNAGILVDIACCQRFFENEPQARPWYWFGLGEGIGTVSIFPVTCREYPCGGSMSLPLLAHQVQGPVGQGNVAVFVSFATAHMNESPGTVDIIYFKVRPFLEPEAAGIDGGKTHPVAEQTHI